MFDKFDKMLEKKGKKISPIELRAKKDVLSEIDGGLSDKMGERLSGLKKVSVMAPDEEGLEKGLDKAKQLVDKMPEMEEEGEEYEEESSELSMEDIDKKIEELMKLKEMMMQEEQGE